MAPGDAERGARPPSEQSPLLGHQASSSDDLDGIQTIPEGKITTIIWTVLAGVFTVGLILVFTSSGFRLERSVPSPESILKSAPVIDGHIGQFDTLHECDPLTTRLYPCIQSDLPALIRTYYANNVSAFNLNEPMPGHVDIPRLRKGRVGGFFWYVCVRLLRKHMVLRFRQVGLCWLPR